MAWLRGNTKAKVKYLARSTPSSDWARDRECPAPDRLKSRRARGVGAKFLWLPLLGAVAFCAAPSFAQSTISRDRYIKAAFLYNFGNYVQWPKESFANAQSPFVIGILGPDPVGAYLRKIAAVKMVDGRKIEVRNFRQAEEVRQCQVLFISKAVAGETQAAALKKLSRRNILSVGETRAFLKMGGVIDFVVQENRVHIFISKSAYQREDLKISAHLLRIATVVD